MQTLHQPSTTMSLPLRPVTLPCTPIIYTQLYNNPKSLIYKYNKGALVHGNSATTMDLHNLAVLGSLWPTQNLGSVYGMKRRRAVFKLVSK